MTAGKIRFLMGICVGACLGLPKAEDSAWVQLFNGKDLGGWTAKFANHALGENPDSTFRVRNGLLEAYCHLPLGQVGMGHLFYVKRKFSYYLARFEYQFPVVDPAPDFPDWSTQNNGFMVHSQDPKTMDMGQSYPSSIECQLLGPKAKTMSAVTANACTCGNTSITLNGQAGTKGCLSAKAHDVSKFAWIPTSVAVYGDSIVHHIVDRETVLTYTRPKLNDSGTPLADGFISIQAEGAYTQFRKIEVLDLVGCMDKTKEAYRSYFVKNDPAACAATTSGTLRRPSPPAITVSRSGGELQISGRGAIQVEIRSLDGTLLRRFQGEDALRILPGTFRMGIYQVQARSAAGTWYRALSMMW